jgi:REP element-mobilizing transposase RayT
MTSPKRNARKDQILSPSRTFFATTKTSMGRPLLQSERNATLWIDVLRSDVAAGRFQLHDFVIMPDHVHVLITVSGDSTIERVMQFIKGGFSYRLKREFGYLGRGMFAQPHVGHSIIGYFRYTECAKTMIWERWLLPTGELNESPGKEPCGTRSLVGRDC